MHLVIAFAANNSDGINQSELDAKTCNQCRKVRLYQTRENMQTSRETTRNQITNGVANFLLIASIIKHITTVWIINPTSIFFFNLRISSR